MLYDLASDYGLNKFKEKCDKLIKSKSSVNLDVVKKTRTIKQNAYLHVIISLFSIEFGLKLNESKQIMKLKCDFMNYDKGKCKILRETRELSKEDMTLFIDFIRSYSSELGCYLPTPEEYLGNKTQIDIEIQKNKHFL